MAFQSNTQTWIKTAITISYICNSTDPLSMILPKFRLKILIRERLVGLDPERAQPIRIVYEFTI